VDPCRPAGSRCETAAADVMPLNTQTHTADMDVSESTDSQASRQSTKIQAIKSSLNGRSIPFLESVGGSKVKVKVNGVQQLATSLNATGTHTPYGIIWEQCYLPPGRGDNTAITAAEAGTRFTDRGRMQG